MTDKSKFMTLFAIISFFTVSWAGMPMATQSVQLNHRVMGDGLLEIEIQINDPRIKGLILKAKLPEDIKLLKARPEARYIKKGMVKWFMDVRSRQKITVLVTLDKAVKESDISVEAIFKIPGKPEK